MSKSRLSIPHVAASSKIGVLERCNAIRRAAKPGEPLNEADHAVISAVYEHFCPCREDEDKGRQVTFSVVRPDNYPTTVSFARNGIIFSMKGLIFPSTHAARVTDAARIAIAPQQSDNARSARRDQSSKCTVSGESLYMRDDIEVDHWPVGFAELWARFLSMNALEPKDIQPVDDIDGGVRLPPNIEQEWSRWHAKHAKLRCLTKQAHAQVTARKGAGT